jgi:pimeloyl-ACP methyl ester carboxylesterase
MRKWLSLAAVLALTGVATALSSTATRQTPHERLGIVLLHGKLGTPGDPRAGLEVIARNLEAEGDVAAVPRMPWGDPGWLQVATDVSGSLRIVDDVVSSLKGRGASRIAVVGHSHGANVGLAYAVTRSGVAGLVMAAPGHRPEELARRDAAMRAAVAEARRLVEDGRGGQPFVGPDGIQGGKLVLRTTAAIYLSWMDPEGLAAMELQASRLPASIPLLLAIARHDPFYGTVEETLYRRAARHPYSRFLPIGGDHSTTPMAASAAIQGWLGSLPR